MAAFPLPVLNRLCRVTIEPRSPAYLLVSPIGQLLDGGGNWTAYGLSDLQRGEIASSQVCFLEGLLPLNGLKLFLPCLKTEDGLCADVYCFPSEAGDWVLLLDASIEERQLSLLQQYWHDLILQSQSAQRQRLHHLIDSKTSRLVPFLPPQRRSIFPSYSIWIGSLRYE